MATTLAWQKRAKALGLEEHQHVGHPVRKVFNSLEETRKWASAVVPDSSESESSLTPADIQGMTDPELRQTVESHVMGASRLSPEATNAVNQRVNSFVGHVAAAPDITVTATTPLIVNSAAVITAYGTITIEPGGYIEISVTCSFSCDQLIKTSGSAASGQPADIIIHGVDGGPGATGAAGPNGSNGGDGKNSECDCCGGEVAHSSSSGGPGTNGGDGSPGVGGGEGGPPITVNMSLGQITGGVTLLSRGGNGGQGGDGGVGGTGGNGGKGGDGGTCGAYHPGGSNGGAAGNGGNGGNNASGGNASNGGTVTVTYDTAKTGSGGSLTAQNSGGAGGAKGQVGAGGAAGTPGAGGSHGGTSGAGGHQGAPGNDVSSAGVDSSAGSLSVNGQPVGV